MAKRVFLKRSNVPGKLPDNKDDVGYGEVLVNYAAGEEFIGLKNSSNEYVRINAHPDAADVKFSGQHSDEGFTGETVESSIQQVEKVIVENESVTSAALNDVKGKISDVETSVSNKVDKVDGKGLSTNDYTTEEKTKLGGIEAGAQVNVKPNWNAASGSTAEILNKPTIPSKASEITFDGEHGDTGFTGDNVQNSIAQIESEIIKNELTISGSLNDINARISAIPEATVTGVTGDILSLESNKLVNATVSIDYGDATTESLNGKKAIKLLGKDNKVLSEIDASAFIKDGMINSVAFNAKDHKLTITFNTDAGKDPIEIDLSTLVDTYKDGDGLSLGEDGTFSVNTDVIAAVGTSADTKDSNTLMGVKKYADTAVKTAKDTVDAYKVNGKAISGNPTLDAADIAIESHSNTGFTGTTVEESIKQIEKEIVDNELTTSGALNNVNNRISDAETAIGNKVDKVDGKGLSTNDYTDKDKAKVDAALTEHQSLADYAKKTDIPDAYTLPSATADILGGVKVGSGLSITTDGTLSYDATKGFDATAIVNKIIMEGEQVDRYITAALTENEFNSIMNAVNLGENIYFTPEDDDGYYDLIVSNRSENGVVLSSLNELYPIFFAISKDENTYIGTYIYTCWFFDDVESSHVTYNGEHPLTDLSGETHLDKIIKGIEQSINNKVDKVEGKALSTNDYTDEEKAKVASALQSYTETDPTVPDWAKQPTKPIYTASEVGALPSTTKIPSKTSELTNDSGFLTEHQQLKTVNGETMVGDGNVTTAYDFSVYYKKIKDSSYGSTAYISITTDEYNTITNAIKTGRGVFALYDDKLVSFTFEGDTTDGNYSLINNTFGECEYIEIRDKLISIDYGRHYRFAESYVIFNSPYMSIELNTDDDHIIYTIDENNFSDITELTITITEGYELFYHSVNEWAIQFEVPSDMSPLPTINWDSSLKWANGEAMTIEAGYMYEFDILKTSLGASIVGQKFKTASE